LSPFSTAWVSVTSIRGSGAHRGARQSSTVADSRRALFERGVEFLAARP
jgi:hypothetical protein